MPSSQTLARPTRKRAPEFKKELKTLAVVAIFILILEIISRVIAPQLDYDRQHIHQFPTIVKELKDKPATAPKVLFYGNSLMRRIDLEAIQNEFDKNGLLHSAKITPVGTNIVDWTYLYKRYFEDTETHPDIIIVGFVRHHIADEEAIKIRRLGRHFLAANDQGQIWEEDLNGDFHRQTQTSLSHYSSLIGDQPEHQLGMLYLAIPSYQAGVRLNNKYVAEAAERHAKETTPTPTTVFRIKRFIDIAKKHNTEIWFVPMPQPNHYDIPQLAIDTVVNSEMKWVDARNIEGMIEDDFSDGYHLGDTGTKKFTHWMSKRLHQYLQEKR